MADQLIIDASTAALIVQANLASVIDVGPAPGSTDALPEGLTNLYHTTARAADAAPVQSVAGRDGDVVLGIEDVDTLQSQLDGKQSQLDQNLNSGESVTFSALTLSQLGGDGSLLIYADDDGLLNKVSGLDAGTQGEFRTSLGCGTAAASNALVDSDATLTGLTVNPPTVGVQAFLIAGKNNTAGGQTPNTVIRGHMFFGSEEGDRGFLIERQGAGSFGSGTMPISFTGVNQNVTAYNNVMFSTGFFAQLYLLQTSGNVGIMNDTPQARLDVNGGILARNTYTSTTNFERGFFRWTSNQLDIGTEKGSGGGSARNMRLLTDNTARVTIGSAGTVTLNTTLALNAQNISTDTTTGTKIGTATTQKIGFFNATPVVQPTAVANATDAATVITQLNALLTRLRTLGLIAT